MVDCCFSGCANQGVKQLANILNVHKICCDYLTDKKITLQRPSCPTASLFRTNDILYVIIIRPAPSGLSYITAGDLSTPTWLVGGWLLAIRVPSASRQIRSLFFTLQSWSSAKSLDFYFFYQRFLD